MNRLNTAGRIAIAALVLLVLAACSSKKAMSVEELFHRGIVEQTNLIDQHIKDPKKHDRLMTQMDRMDVVLRDLAARLEKQATEIDALMLDYGATAEDFEALRTTFDAEQEQALDKVLEIRGEMRKLMTQEEWAKTSRRKYKILAY